MPIADAIPHGAVCPWPQKLRRLQPRRKSRSRIRVRVRSHVDGRVLRICSEDEARQMCAENSFGNPLEGVDPVAVRLSRKKAPLTDIRLRTPERDEKPSPCTLTMGDMLTNGIGAVTPELRKQGLFSNGQINALKIGNYVDRAMSKVEAWPEVHDERNVVIAAGKAYGVLHIPAPEERYLNFA